MRKKLFSKEYFSWKRFKKEFILILIIFICVVFLYNKHNTEARLLSRTLEVLIASIVLSTFSSFLKPIEDETK